MPLPDHCPNCGASFQGEPIPEKHRELYGDETHFGRLITIYDIYADRTTQFRCPDCGYTWDRDTGKEVANG